MTKKKEKQKEESTNQENWLPYTVWLPYYKQGSDLASALEEATKDNKEDLDAHAFLLHAEALDAASYMLNELAEVAKNKLLKIEDCDTHMIIVSCSEKTAAILEDKGIGIELMELEDEDGEVHICEECMKDPKNNN